MIKTNIKMRVTPEQSVKVQEICFNEGCSWYNSNRHIYTRYLFIHGGSWIIQKSDSKHYYEAHSFKEINPELFIKTNGTCKDFKYPVWFKSKKWDYIVEFTDLRHGIVVVEGINSKINKDFSCSIWTAHTDSEIWEQVENPNNKSEMDTSINNGGKTDYYQLKNAPFLINDFDDFAEWRKMNGNQFNMGKAMWTFNTGRHSGTDYERDLNKIIHYANRELLRLKRGEKMKVVIQQTSDLKNYIVITDDGREFIVKDVNEAIELKNKLQDVQDTK